MARKVNYPTTLDQVAEPGHRVHLTAEFNGMRFYLGGFPAFAPAEAAVPDFQKKAAGLGVSFYLVDRAGNHFLSSDAAGFAAEIDRARCKAALGDVPAYFTIGRKRHAFKTLADASATWCAMRDARNIGAGAQPAVTLHNAAGKAIAHVSYNGKIWAGASGRDWTPESALLFNPYA